MSKHSGFTLVEVLIASTVMVLFLAGGFALYMQGQNTISKSSWINNSTREEGFMLRELAELAKSSSYPTTVLSNVIKVAEKEVYKAKLPLGTGIIAPQKTPFDLLAFPICSPQIIPEGKNSPEAGRIKWVILRLQKQQSSKYYDLDLIETPEEKYSPNAPNYVSDLNDFGYSDKATIDKHKIILHDIEGVEVTTEAIDSTKISSVKIDFILSYPKSPTFKKKVTVKFPLNILFKI